MAQAFNSSTQEADICEFKASLVYKASSRTAGTVTQRNSVSKKIKQNKTNIKSQRALRPTVIKYIKQVLPEIVTQACTPQN